MPSELALEGGVPVRANMLPYGRHDVGADDVEAVRAVLESDWLTTGPEVSAFESALASVAGVPHAVALSNGTAALHAAMAALGVGRGDEVIVPAMTFVASANCVLYQGGTPVFADVDAGTLLIDAECVARRITPRTRAIIAVDYAGQPCDYPALRAIAAAHGVALVADAAHSLGASLENAPVGALADLSTFSFHPVKHITTGEGGAVTTALPQLAERLRVFRNHGIGSDWQQRALSASWLYEMTELGFNYRITDFQCALGRSQLSKLETWVARRNEIAARYDEVLGELEWLRPLERRPGRTHAYHLYVARIQPGRLKADRARIFAALRAEGIGVNVHYIPVHLHPFYRRNLGTDEGLCPRAEAAYEEILSLPIFSAMCARDLDDVREALDKVGSAYAR